MAEQIQGGDGSQQPQNLELSLAELEELENKQDDPNKPEEGNEPEEGTGKTPEELEAEAKAAEEAAKAEPGTEQVLEEDPAEAEAFITEVNKLHGFDNFKVEYPEGVDPLTPEGIHFREKALMEYVREDYDSTLKQADPRGYAYLLHRQSGKPDEEFFGTETVTLPSYETFKNSVDLQKQLITKDLEKRGVDKEIIDATIEKAVKDGKLFDKADAAYKTVEAAEQKALADAERNATERAQREATAIQQTVDAITDVVMNSKVSNIVIPDAKRAEFAEHIKQHLFFDGENFFLTKPITKDTLAEAIQAEYFGFVKGDLKALVERRAKTQNAERLRINTQKTKTSTKTGNEGGRTSGFVPLGDL